MFSALTGPTSSQVDSKTGSQVNFKTGSRSSFKSLAADTKPIKRREYDVERFIFNKFNVTR